MPCGDEGRGRREVTDDVETGNGEEVSVTLPEPTLSDRTSTEIDATRTRRISAVVEGRAATADGAGVLVGRAKVWDMEPASGDRRYNDDAEARMTPRSDDHDAVTEDGRSSLRNNPRFGEKTKA